jgi:hypothetical protein
MYCADCCVGRRYVLTHKQHTNTVCGVIAEFLMSNVVLRNVTTGLQRVNQKIINEVPPSTPGIYPSCPQLFSVELYGPRRVTSCAHLPYEQHKRPGVSKREGRCLLRGTSCIFICNSGYLKSQRVTLMPYNQYI